MGLPRRHPRRPRGRRLPGLRGDRLGDRAADRAARRARSARACASCGSTSTTDASTSPALVRAATHAGAAPDGACFDAVVNNADRKGGHLLPTPDGHVYGVDHGVCFSVEDKLRTVLWRWRGKPLPAEAVEVLERLADELRGDLGERCTSTSPAARCGDAARVDRAAAHRPAPRAPGTGPRSLAALLARPAARRAWRGTGAARGRPGPCGRSSLRHLVGTRGAPSSCSPACWR